MNAVDLATCLLAFTICPGQVAPASKKFPLQIPCKPQWLATHWLRTKETHTNKPDNAEGTGPSSGSDRQGTSSASVKDNDFLVYLSRILDEKQCYLYS